MLAPSTAALLPVFLGTLVGLMPGLSRRLLGPLRTLALIAALTVVFGDLLPRSILATGMPALALFLFALIVPTAAERAHTWLRHRTPSEHGLALELGYLGLLLHQALDGAQIGAAYLLDGGEGVTIAVAAHSTPLVAVAVLGYAAHDGLPAALRRALGLGVAGLLGALSVGAMGPWLETVQPWLAAGVSGLLLNIITHDLTADLPQTPGGRLADLTAAAVGLLVPLTVSSHTHAEEAHIPPAGLLLAAVAVTALLLPRLWRRGVRGCLSDLLPTSGGHSHHSG